MIATLPIPVAKQAIIRHERNYWRNEPTPTRVGPCWRLSARRVNCRVELYGVWSEYEVENIWYPAPAGWLVFNDTATISVAGNITVE